ncbi:MAG: SAM hydroxide adenosyltransferase, partial [Candidatus Bathyarchaeia archaeon]
VFDGRDVFGPVGALLAKGVEPLELGAEISGYVRLPIYEPEIVGSRVEARVIHIDGFGNLVTNITYEILERIGARYGCHFAVDIHGREYRLPYVRHFSALPKGGLLLLVAGGGYLELAVNQGNAQERLGAVRGEKVSLRLLR